MYKTTIDALSSTINGITSVRIVPDSYQGDLQVPYVRVSFVVPQSRLGYLRGSGIHGMVMFRVFVARESDVKDSATVINSLETALANKNLSNLVFDYPSVQPMGADPVNSALQRYDVTFPFKLFGAS